MEWVAKRLTNYILAKQVIEEEDRLAYEYGFQTGLEKMICILVSLLIAAWMGKMWETILLLVIFFSQRAFVKGIHMKQYWSCFLLSCSVIALGGYWCDRITISQSIMFPVALICLIGVQLLSDRFEPEEDEKAVNYYNKQRKRIAIAVAIVTVVMFALHIQKGLFLVCYAEVIMLISTTAEWIKENGKNQERRHTTDKCDIDR